MAILSASAPGRPSKRPSLRPLPPFRRGIVRWLSLARRRKGLVVRYTPRDVGRALTGSRNRRTASSVLTLLSSIAFSSAKACAQTLGSCFERAPFSSGRRKRSIKSYSRSGSAESRALERPSPPRPGPARRRPRGTGTGSRTSSAALRICLDLMPSRRRRLVAEKLRTSGSTQRASAPRFACARSSSSARRTGVVLLGLGLEQKMLESLAALSRRSEPRDDDENGENQLHARVATFCKVGISFAKPARVIGSISTNRARLRRPRNWDTLRLGGRSSRHPLPPSPWSL